MMQWQPHRFLAANASSSFPYTSLSSATLLTACDGSAAVERVVSQLALNHGRRATGARSTDWPNIRHGIRLGMLLALRSHDVT
jgi:hypothetical protein